MKNYIDKTSSVIISKVLFLKFNDIKVAYIEYVVYENIELFCSTFFGSPTLKGAH